MCVRVCALVCDIIPSIPELRAVAVSSGAWRSLEHLAASENVMVQRAAVGGLCNLAMSDVIIERMLDRQGEGHERYMKIFLVIAHSPDEQAAVYARAAPGLQCCLCVSNSRVRLQLRPWRCVQPVLLPRSGCAVL